MSLKTLIMTCPLLSLFKTKMGFLYSKYQGREFQKGSPHSSTGHLPRPKSASSLLQLFLSPTNTLHLELRSVMCNGAEENQAHRCDPYGLRVQEQPLFLVCSSITIFTSIHRSENSNAGADQK